MNPENPNLAEMFGEFDAGIFTNKATEAIKLVTIGTVQHRKKGQIIIILDFDPIGESDSVKVKHTLKYNRPTKNGKQTEENATTTPMYVNREGYLTISPQLQEDLFKNNQSDNVVNLKGKNNG